MSNIVTAVAKAAGELIAVVLVAPVAAVAEASRRLWSRSHANRDRLEAVEDELEIDDDTTRLDRMEQMQRQQHLALYGDPDDPRDEGMRGEVHQIHGRIEAEHEDSD
jgi:hypothetical protein